MDLSACQLEEIKMNKKQLHIQNTTVLFENPGGI